MELSGRGFTCEILGCTPRNAKKRMHVTEREKGECGGGGEKEGKEEEKGKKGLELGNTQWEDSAEYLGVEGHLQDKEKDLRGIQSSDTLVVDF